MQQFQQYPFPLDMQMGMTPVNPNQVIIDFKGPSDSQYGYCNKQAKI